MRSRVLLCLFVLIFFTIRRASAEHLPDVAHLLKNASKGDVNAQFMLGLAYEFGRGVAKDSTEAAHWYEKAANAGDPGAQTHLGNLYAEGNGVARDQALAIKWYLRAATRGDS